MTNTRNEAERGLHAIDWRMSATLMNVAREGQRLPEVTSLEGAVRDWLSLEGELRGAARLRPERPVTVDGTTWAIFQGEEIRGLAAHLRRRKP